MNVSAALATGWRRKLPVVLQTEVAECGLACLAMIAAYHGRHSDLGALRRRFPVSLKGATLASLIDVANRLGLATRAVRLELENLGALKLPCILHWNFDHFVVLKRVGARSITVHDPARGARALSRRDVSGAFTGVALELWPQAEFTRVGERRAVRLRDLLGRTTGLKRSLAQILLLAIALELFTLAAPLLLQWTVDHALVTGSRGLVTTLALGFGLLVLLKESTATLRAWIIMHCGATLSLQWHANVLSHLLRLPLGYFERRHLGDIVSRFRSIDVIQRTLTGTFVEAVVDGLMTAFVAIVMWRYSPTLTALAAGAVTLYALIRRLSYRPLRDATEQQIVHAATQESHFLETVRGARAIKLFRREAERRSSWLALLSEQMNAGLRAQKLQIVCRALNGIVFGVENVLAVAIGARLVLDVQLSVGMLLALLAYKGQLTARVAALIDKLLEIAMLRLQGERLADIVLTEPEAAPAAGRLAGAETLEPSIAIGGLRFRYAEHEPYVLDGVDLAIAAGESVAIVGPSGGGKSTLLHLLLGVMPPTAGEIRIGGSSLAQIDPATLRRTIGSVTQNDTLFAGSIADNISFFDPQADQAWIEECARLAAIHADVVAMPMAYNTFVGFVGSVLSGGQQQRVLLARALYKRPAILVLDEATSHLDVKREIVVSAAIRALNITRLIVAHRPQTAATADRIVTLERGRITRETRVTPNATALQNTRLERALLLSAGC